MEPDRLYILGAGSIGLMLAAHLSGNRPVVLIRRAGQALPDIAHITVERGVLQNRYQVTQISADTLDAPIPHLIVCTKAHDTLDALQGLSGFLRADSKVLLMQNGMGSQQAVAKNYPALSVHAAISTEAVFRTGSDTVVHAARGVTRIGRLQGTHFNWVGLFQAGGLKAETVEPVERALLGKLRINALINPLTALYGCRNGELLERPEALEQMRALGEEVDSVLEALGHEFAEPSLPAAKRVAESTAANYSSMHQDMEARRPLEIDYITGWLVEKAHELGIPVPANEAILTDLKQS